MLYYIIYFVSACTIQLTLLYGFKKYTDHKEKIYWDWLLLALVFASIMTIEYYYKIVAINTLSSIVFYIILFYKVFKRNIRETIFYGISLWIIGVLIDFIAMCCSPILSEIPLLIVKIIYTIMMEIMLIIIFQSKSMKKLLNKLYKKILKVKFPIIEIGTLFIVLFSLGYTLYFFTIENNLELTKKSYYILILSILVLIILYIKSEYKKYTLKETNDYLITNNEVYIKAVNDYRILKHNIIHQLNGIKSVSNKKTIKLIDDLILLYTQNTQSAHNIKKMPMGISGIVYEKIYSYDSKDLQLRIDNNIESNVFNNLNARSYNLLCEALGILLDNALQATGKTKEKIIMIDMNETKSTYNIKIINTFNEILDLEKLGTIKYTTKKEGNGIGLFSIIGRKKIKVKAIIINNLFINEVVIEKKNG